MTVSKHYGTSLSPLLQLSRFRPQPQKHLVTTDRKNSKQARL